MDTKEIYLRRKFNKLSQDEQPKSKIFVHCLNAFWVGGIICDIGQLISDIFLHFGIPADEVSIITTICMIFLSALFTGLGIYDKIAGFAGAGTIVPITGFANSIVSPAMEFKKEGYVFGVGAKMFTIAGPVLVYGISSSVLVGVVYYVISIIF